MTQTIMEQHVILLDDAANPSGTAPKHAVHTTDTPLHLAFSCHVTNEAGDVLVTRRALSKRAWPGVWTNAFCGHPYPGEAIEDAIARHAWHELGLELGRVAVALPDFRYRARDASGIVENEVCPVYTAVAMGTPQPQPSEVMELQWVTFANLARGIAAAPWAFSPWLVLQAQQLPALRQYLLPAGEPERNFPDPPAGAWP